MGEGDSGFSTGGTGNFPLAIFGLEIIVNLAVPCLFFDDDAAAVVENRLYPYTLTKKDFRVERVLAAQEKLI